MIAWFQGSRKEKSFCQGHCDHEKQGHPPDVNILTDKEEREADEKRKPECLPEGNADVFKRNRIFFDEMPNPESEKAERAPEREK